MLDMWHCRSSNTWKFIYYFSKECCFISLIYLFATSVSIINLQIVHLKPFSLFYETLEFFFVSFSPQSVFSLLPRCRTRSCPQRTDCCLCRAVPARPDSLSQNAFLLSQSLPSKLVEEVFASASQKILPQLEPFARRKVESSGPRLLSRPVAWYEQE